MAGLIQSELDHRGGIGDLDLRLQLGDQLLLLFLQLGHPLLRAQGDVSVLGLVVSVDRMERGTGDKSALAEIEEKFGLRTTAIVTMQEVVECLYNREYNGRVVIDDELKASIDDYYRQYGPRA